MSAKKEKRRGEKGRGEERRGGERRGEKRSVRIEVEFGRSNISDVNRVITME